MSAAASNRVTVEGCVGRGFEGVRDVFSENFARRRELGGACCVYLRGEKVVAYGAACGTGGPGTRGSRTRWSSSGRPRRGSPR